SPCAIGTLYVIAPRRKRPKLGQEGQRREENNTWSTAGEMGQTPMNDELRRKVRVLQQLSIAAYPDAMLVYLCGMLMGAVHRVHFVRDLEGAPIAIQISMGRARVWPTPAWQATVGGMTIPDPLTLA